MITNYFKTAWRSLLKNRFFSFINIFGLAVGLTCCMLIALYLNHEFTYDHQHKKADRTYLVGTIFRGGEKENVAPGTPAPMGEALLGEYPELESYARTVSLFVDDKTLLQYKQGQQLQSFYETKGFMADSSLFGILDYAFTEGNPQTALAEPNSVVLSEDVARKIFGTEPALDKLIHISSNTNGEGDYRITGVYRNNQASHLDARFFLSINSGGMGAYIKTITGFATNNFFYTYILLKPGQSALKLESKLPQFVDKYMSADLKMAGFSKKQFLLNIKDIHLRSGFGARDVSSGYGSLSYLYILAFVALFVLVIACINFMNLATAKSAKRAAEVGIRKVLGAGRKGLMGQFLGESVLLSLLSFVVAVILVLALLPLFSRISGVTLTIDLNRQWPLWLGFAGLSVFTGLLSGSYPAFYLSAFKPIKVLKGKFANSLSAINMRKGLVVFQFLISAVLIICAMGVGKQMNYLNTADMGFRPGERIVIPLRSNNAKQICTSFKNELSQQEMIRAVGASQYFPGIFNPRDQNWHLPQKSRNEAVNVKMNAVDYDFLKTIGIQTLAGRTFSRDFPGDSLSGLVMNETAIRLLGFASPQEAIGKTIVFEAPDSAYRSPILGVVKDFNFESLQKPISPFAFELNASDNYNYVIAQTNGGDSRRLLAMLEGIWKKLNPSEPFEYSFMDEEFQKNYRAEQRLAALIRYFMIIAIIISCLGLFGLAAFSAEQRTREIGIRKVLGSSTFAIMNLLSKEFIKLVLIGNIIAIPLAYWVMQEWLKGFAYQTNLSWWLFGAALTGSLLIAVITVSFQALRAAWANPIASLRAE